MKDLLLQSVLVSISFSHFSDVVLLWKMQTWVNVYVNCCRPNLGYIHTVRS